MTICSIGTLGSALKRTSIGMVWNLSSDILDIGSMSSSSSIRRMISDSFPGDISSKTAVLAASSRPDKKSAPS